MNRDDEFADSGQRMVAEQISARDVRDPRVLAVLGRVPRHLFVPPAYRRRAYEDEPLPIGDGQTISQPYIVGYMTEALGLKGGERVLEIGTGSGYQTAVLAEMAGTVFTVEKIPALLERARALLDTLGYANIRFRTGDGALGWPEEAPFEAIIVTAAPPRVPEALRSQLSVGGRLILPVGEDDQDLVLIVRDERGFRERKLISVRFVPLV